MGAEPNLTEKEMVRTCRERPSRAGRVGLLGAAEKEEGGREGGREWRGGGEEGVVHMYVQ